MNMGVRKRKVSLGNIAEEGPVGTQKKTSKVSGNTELRGEDHLHGGNEGSHAFGGDR